MNGLSRSTGLTRFRAEYLKGRNNIKSLCLVNKRTRRLATPLLYQSVLIWQPKHLWALGRAFATDTSLALHVRHFNCAVNLEEAGTAVASHVWELWQFPNHWTGDGIGASHPYHRFSNWFVQCEAVYSSRFILNRRAGQAFFCAILCLTNRVETLNLHLPNMFALAADPRLRSGPVSSLWKWFLDDTNPFAEFSKVIPMAVTTGSPTTPQLLERPCWPPPLLRKITVEISPDHDACAPGSYVHLDVIPPIDAWRHAALLKLNGLALFDPVDVLRPCRLRKLSPAEILCVTGYLDGLQRIPYIADSSDTMITHLERLKHFDNYLSSPDYDHASAQGLARVLRLLPAPGRWNSRLLTRSKALSLPMWALFLLDFRQLSPPSSISALTFRYDMGDPGPTPSLGFFQRGYFMQTKLFGPAVCKAYMASLEELHLPLRYPTNLAGPVSFGIDRLKLSSAETGSYLPRLKVLELTTEGLFGSLLNMHRVFGGERFTRSSTVGCCDRLDIDGIPHTSPMAPSPSTRDLEAVVDELPPALTELKLIEWWFYFSEPMIMPVRFTQRKPSMGEMEEGWPERYKHVQRAFVAGLRELARVLGERRPSVNKVTVVMHSWTTGQYWGEALDEDKREAGQVWMSWARQKTVGLRALKRVYRDKGIVLKVAMAKGD